VMIFYLIMGLSLAVEREFRKQGSIPQAPNAY